MLQQDVPDDYVIATNETHSIREFLDVAFNHIGIDLQKELHEDILSNPSRYPNIDNPDHNIDHRRVPNLEIFSIILGGIVIIAQLQLFACI